MTNFTCLATTCEQEVVDLVRESVDLMKEHEPPGGYYGCFSGGKDSVLLHELARIAGVRAQWFYHQTTIDPPEVLKFIKKEYPHVIWKKPEKGSFFRRCIEKGVLPTRRIRWCCSEYKEIKTPAGTVQLLGIRGEESPARAKRPVYEKHRDTGAMMLLPIMNWDSESLWGFTETQELKQCSLYAEGFKRIGCVGCPLASQKNRKIEMARWPGYAKQWERAARKIWERRAGTEVRGGKEWFGSARFDNWQEWYDWWLHDKKIPVRKGESGEQYKLNIGGKS